MEDHSQILKYQPSALLCYNLVGKSLCFALKSDWLLTPIILHPDWLNNLSQILPQGIAPVWGYVCLNVTRCFNIVREAFTNIYAANLSEFEENVSLNR